MKQKQTEGIVLKSFAYKETERIVHLFSEQDGIIHLLVKYLSPKKTQRINLTTPLCRGHYLYLKRKSDLYTFVDGTILDLHMPLRTSLTTLTIGGKMLDAIHRFQLPEKPAPALYRLLAIYLKYLSKSPEVFWSSFQLKLLKHEGLLSLEKPHLVSPEGVLLIEEEDWPFLLLLLEGRDAKILSSLPLSPALQENIQQLFKSAKGGT